MDGLLLVVLAVLALTAVCLWALVDSALQPAQAYTAAGISRPMVTVMLVMTCLVGTVVYAALLRPRLVRAVRPH